MRGRPPVPIEVQRKFWQQIRSGLIAVEAAEAVGVSRATGQRLFGRSGGVTPSIVNPSSGYRLSLAEREEIACLRAAKHGVREIARSLGRDPATISRELRRNTTGPRGRYRDQPGTSRGRCARSSAQAGEAGHEPVPAA